MDLSTNLSLTCGDNLNYYKSIHHPIRILPAGIEKKPWQFPKKVSKLSFHLIIQLYSLLGQT